MEIIIKEYNKTYKMDAKENDSIIEITKKNNLQINRFVALKNDVLINPKYKIKKNDKICLVRVILHDSVKKNKTQNENLTCSFCKKQSITCLYENNTNFCKKHFTRYIEKMFMKTIREFKMIKKNSLVGIAISGGKDSCVLLDLLCFLKKKFPFRIICIHIKKHKKIDVFIKKICKKYDCELEIIDMEKEIGLNLIDIAKITEEKNLGPVCSVCGVFSRYLINKKARELNCDCVANGHNLDDMAQTLIMNIKRSDVQRILRITPNGGIIDEKNFIRRIRPLCNIEERHVALYAFLKKLNNEKIRCPYGSVSFREHMRDQIDITENLYPGTKRRIFKSMLYLQKELKSKINEKLKKCKFCDEPSANVICKKCEILEILNEKNKIEKNTK